MKKFVSTLIVGFLVVVFAVAWIPGAQGARPTDVSGTWCWMVPLDSVQLVRVADGNVFLSAIEHEELSGTFEGTGMGTFTLMIHPAGFNTVKGESHVSVTVQGKSGSLHLGWAGHTMTEQGVWWFHWTILSGAGELEGLRGQGTGFGPGPAGPDVWGCAEMSGTVVFAPG